MFFQDGSILLALLLVMVFSACNSQAQEETQPLQHPMDPLTVDEYLRTVDLLRAADHIDDASRFSIITLHEPPKTDVLAWQPGSDLPRAAFAVIKQGSQTFEAVVDVSAGNIVSWTEIPDVQPGILLEEILAVGEILAANVEFQAALALRGLTDPTQLLCVPHSLGYFGIAEHEGRRLLKSVCLYAGDSNNLFARPVEGLHAIIDLNARDVVEVVDTGVIPLSDNPGRYDEASLAALREALKPTVYHQPNGNNFSINGHVVEWDNWSFHQRMDKRMGLVISTVNYQDGESQRPILYQGALSEIFVPYMDPDPAWFSRTFLDEGEFGFGASATKLAPGFDCPETGVLLDVVLPDDRGAPYPAEDVICIFERNTGDPAWRHFDNIAGSAYEGRRAIELVVRMIATIGNYDYLTDWVFTQDGRIIVRAAATGIDGLKGVVSTSMQDETAGENTIYGTLVAPNLVAINHDHFLSFRLDIDVDGPANSFSKDRLKTVTFDDGPRRSAWVVQSSIAQTEKDAMMDYDPSAPAMWRILNPNAPGPVGHQPGYVLRPGNSAVYNLLSDEDYPLRRVGFINHHVWVTPYHQDERFAAGNYVIQNKDGGGLPAWTRANRPIENTDIVLWYTAGFHHAPRTEDYPLMPTAWHQFELRPYNFFEGNPALDLPTEWRE